MTASRFEATFDLIDHRIPCSECGAVPKSAVELDMQTKIWLMASAVER